MLLTRYPAHNTIKRIDFSDEGPFADTTDGGITGQFSYRVQPLSE